MSNHTTLAMTAVGLREIAKKIGQAHTRWEAPPKTIMIVTKLHDPALVALTVDAARWLKTLGMTVLLQRELLEQSFAADPDPNSDSDSPAEHRHDTTTAAAAADAAADASDTTGAAAAAGAAGAAAFDPLTASHASIASFASMASMASVSSLASEESSLVSDSLAASAASAAAAPRSDSPRSPEDEFGFWDEAFCASPAASEVDIVVTFGGDGTVLFAAWLFQQKVPPIVPFNLGSLGFLTVFDHAAFKASLLRVLQSDETGLRMNFRMRFSCTVRRKPRSDGAPALDDGAVYNIINDLVVDRGPSPYLSQLELYGNEKHLTTVQADGLVIATPTGSTAYSLSAGGSVVHPDVSAILVTPICPHTLSFRPMILPDTMDVKIVVPRDSRATAWVSFDGRHRVQLQPGDSIQVCASKYPVPTVCFKDQSSDWFHGLEECLAWNRRERQKKLTLS